MIAILAENKYFLIKKTRHLLNHVPLGDKEVKGRITVEKYLREVFF